VVGDTLECGNQEPSYTKESDHNIPRDVEVNCAALQPAPLLVVDVSVGGSTIKALVDSGASSSLIRASCVPPNVVVDENVQEIVGLGGAVWSRGSFSCSVVVSGLREVHASFVVVGDLDLGYAAVLGSNFLVRGQITVDMSRSRLSQPLLTGFCEVYLSNSGGLQHVVHRGIPAYSSEEIEINRNDSALVPIFFPEAESGDYLFEGNIMVKRKHFSAADGVLSFQGGQSRVAVYCRSDSRNETEVLPKGTLMGTVNCG